MCCTTAEGRGDRPGPQPSYEDVQSPRRGAGGSAAGVWGDEYGRHRPTYGVYEDDDDDADEYPYPVLDPKPWNPRSSSPLRSPGRARKDRRYSEYSAS
ncbi:hypothetical protein GCM10014713_38330 [Streptomyces purpureus]|uniref:Uncharacterized protein n=1 Tax=Streptomyces purpureus TaxID=1951 RepID=A0A918H5R7_9ACTN|nr:hypothetical protein GCM10014713_38330 [Streptomyces purpureus]